MQNDEAEAQSDRADDDAFADPWPAPAPGAGPQVTYVDESEYYLTDDDFYDVRASPRSADRSVDTGRGGYTRASDAVWARARQDYLAGDAAETVCARYDLGLSTLRQRARAEGWRRRDQPDPEPVDLEAEVEAGLPDYADIARHALVRMNRAVLAGRGPEAAGWMRIHRQMLEMARAANETPPPRQPPPKAAPQPAPLPDPDLDPSAEVLEDVMRRGREIEAIARAAAALAPGDLAGRRRLDARLAALELQSVSHHSHHSDGVFSAAEPDDARRADPPP
ncbi:hypothetical protein E4M02_00440 [Brevundimonas sp. S30B]|uniref:hypothetical protein n=1 Tax=unclassified Brevundimonas TaxID=2622653 RepID=UPI001072ACDF|nr:MULTISPECIES: hypothetical protein [unclassified Brevundimonas]QBX37608.1 hypothetical protein E4M01_07380 [Brevundimonas sp. MF30-B]TFW03599.1 hypothetical protein E4M02_00440 [Brevundimonas sp. S30B]